MSPNDVAAIELRRAYYELMFGPILGPILAPAWPDLPEADREFWRDYVFVCELKRRAAH